MYSMTTWKRLKKLCKIHIFKLRKNNFDGIGCKSTNWRFNAFFPLLNPLSHTHMRSRD